MVTKSINPKVLELERRARGIAPVDSAHDFSHIERVSRLCVDLYAREIFTREKREIKSDEADACLVAAFLHDCVPIAKNSPLRKESSRLASEKAHEWLTEMNFSTPAWIDLICGAILDHSFSAGRIPASLLGECLQDADRLEALGAIGLYRTIATGVSMGTELFDPEDPWAERRELDDKKYAIDHFFTKLLKLPATFRTESAKQEASQRAQYLQGFADQLRSELSGSISHD